MRLFNKHYKASPKGNPTSKRVQNIGKKFEALLRKNPQKYREIFKEAFGKEPLAPGAEHDPLAELYEAIGKRATEEGKLRELEKLFPGPMLDREQRRRASKLVSELGALNRRLAKLPDEAVGEIEELKEERKEIKARLNELQKEMTAPSRALREQSQKVARARRAEEKLQLEEEGRRRLTRPRGTGPLPHRYGEKEAARMEELEAQSREEMSIRKKGGAHRKGVPLGEAFPIEDTGFRGIIQPPIPGQTGLFADQYSWGLYDPQDEFLLSGTSKTHSVASQSVRIAFEVATDLANDVDLDRGRKRWLRDASKAPGFNRWVRRAKAEGERGGIMRRFKRREIAGAGKGFQTYEPRTRASGRRFKRPVELELGEEESTKGQDYTVIVRRDMEGYWTKVVTKPMESGKPWESGWAGPFLGAKGIEKAYIRGEALGAGLTGAKEFITANPARRKVMAASARRTLARRNPKLEREPLTGEEKFGDISAAIGIPDDPDQAYRVGYAFGVIAGIDTAGLQNFMKRRRIRKRYEQDILDAFKKIGKAALAPSEEGRPSRLPRTVS